MSQKRNKTGISFEKKICQLYNYEINSLQNKMLKLK